MKDVLLSPNETLDSILSQDIKIIQKKEGYRFSLDAVLLANFAGIKEGNRIIELGTGSGVVSLILAKKESRAKQILGVEIQTELAELAERNVKLNHLTHKVKILKRDLKDLKEEFAPESFDLVLSNPPYRKIQSGKINPNPEKAIARHEIMTSIADILEIAGFLVKFRGRVALIYSAFRLADLIFQMRLKKLEPKMIRFIHPNVLSEGNLVMVEARKGGKEELKILRPLFVYDLTGGYSQELKNILTMP